MIGQCERCARGEIHHILPDLGRDDFTCPHCDEHALQEHLDVVPGRRPRGMRSAAPAPIWGLTSTRCKHCGAYALWRLDDSGDLLLDPPGKQMPRPSSCLPDEVKCQYEEARSIFPTSGRASVATLRLALRALCVRLGGAGQNLRTDMEALWTNHALSPDIMTFFNLACPADEHATDPGRLDPYDPTRRGDRNTAVTLATLINRLADDLQSQLRGQR